MGYKLSAFVTHSLMLVGRNHGLELISAVAMIFCLLVLYGLSVSRDWILQSGWDKTRPLSATERKT